MSLQNFAQQQLQNSGSIQNFANEHIEQQIPNTSMIKDANTHSSKNRMTVLSKNSGAKSPQQPNVTSDEMDDLSKMAAQMNMLLQQRQQLELLKQSQQWMNDRATADLSSPS